MKLGFRAFACSKAGFLGAVCICAAVVALSACVAGATDVASASRPAAGRSSSLLRQDVFHSTRLTPPHKASPGGRWRLRFNASFAGTRLNTKIWKTCFPWTHNGAGCTNYGNYQLEWFLPSQVHVNHGILSLVAKKERVIGLGPKKKPRVFDCASGMVTTNRGLNFTYGVVQVVAKISGPKGMWPALWLAASNKQWPPEIDMMEHWFAFHHDTALFLHPRIAHLARYVKPRRISVWPVTANLAVGWHTYTLVWTRSSLTFFIDGQVRLIARQNIPHQRMYFVADLADEMSAKSGGCSGSLELRSVKVWQN
jgi:beta-glucanase (GH16 family)